MSLPDASPILDAEPVPRILDAIILPDAPAPRRGILWFLGAVVWGVAAVIEWLFGAGVLMVGLAILAALPIVQFLSLGYLLEAGARVARTGRLRDGFIGIRLAARLGGIVLMSSLFLLIVRVFTGLAQSATILDPGGRGARNWRIGLIILVTITAFHLLTAIARGGRIRYFFWPFNGVWLLRRLLRGGYYAQARDGVWNTVAGLRLPYYFWLGVRGFVGAFVWLIVPVSLLALGSQSSRPGMVLLGYLGAFLFAVVLLYLPFLQVRMAAVNCFRAIFDLNAVRADYRRAPFAFAFALVVTLLSALPLYLLKIELVPSEAIWLPALVFIVFLFPARLLTGWALGRARQRATPRHWFFRWIARVPLLPASLFYVLMVYLTQFTSWNGVWSLSEQHVFLVPVPFFGK
jgi:hypothetical protein